MRDFAYSWITEQPIFVRGPLCRDANNTETLLFIMFLARVLYGHKAEEVSRGVSVHNLYKLLWCVMET